MEGNINPQVLSHNEGYLEVRALSSLSFFLLILFFSREIMGRSIGSKLDSWSGQKILPYLRITVSTE
jgi:hypothetical protein